MAIYELTSDSIKPVLETDFATEGILERGDLQRLFRDQIHILVADVMVIAEEFGEWEDSLRRIDLLCLDRDANLVVIEFKRGNDGGHMDLQAIRYAAMVANLTFRRVVEAHQRYLASRSQSPDQAEQAILQFLKWDEPQEANFGSDTRIVLVAGDFGAELTTAVLWLNERDLDIRCFRLQPHNLDGRTLLNIDQVLPLPEASEYQVRLREKATGVRESIRDQGEWSGYWFVNVGEKDGPNSRRSWDDCRKYGFVSAGGGPRWRDQLRRLKPGDRIFAYLSEHGYVGHGTVTSEAVMQRDFVPPGLTQHLVDLPLERPPRPENLDDPDRAEYCIGVEWHAAVERANAFRTQDGQRRQTVCRLHEPALVQVLSAHFHVPLGE